MNSTRQDQHSHMMLIAPQPLYYTDTLLWFIVSCRNAASYLLSPHLEQTALGTISRATINISYTVRTCIRVSFRGSGGALDLLSPPLIEVAVILLLRSNRFLAPPCDRNNRFAPPWNDF